MESGSVLQSNDKLETTPKSSSRSNPKSRSTSKSAPKSVKIRLLKNAVYKIKGIEGKQYVFNGAGSVLNVDTSDVKLLMKKNENRPDTCCGNTSNSKIFELV